MKCLVLILLMVAVCGDDMLNAAPAPPLRILNFQADNGFNHDSKAAALALVEILGKKNGWEVVTTTQASSLTQLDLKRFDVVILNNNCGNKEPIMNPAEHAALQAYIRNGGGFVGIHCAGAVWKEGGEFQPWFEGLIGAKLIDHSVARFLIFDRPFTDAELAGMVRHLMATYKI